MASRRRRSAAAFFILCAAAAAGRAAGCYTRIFSFGDSLTDTGNYIYTHRNDSDNPIRMLHYGDTFFHHPSGRFSDGRLIVDFIAEALGLPYVPPFLAAKGPEEFRHGADFAMGGATAAEHSFFIARGMAQDDRVASLSEQLDWFKAMAALVCSDAVCCDIYNGSLFLVGEIGINDYTFLVVHGTPPADVRAVVPSIVQTIASAVRELIELGARTVVVPGTFPSGCWPMLLTRFDGELRAGDLDPRTGCITWLNDILEYHNQLLNDELDAVRRLHPGATVVYADYFNAVMDVIASPSQYGFKETLYACCGGRGPYNFSLPEFCGLEGSAVCDDPSEYVSWDGCHLTEAVYKIIAHGVLAGPYATPSVTETCAGEVCAAPQRKVYLYNPIPFVNFTSIDSSGCDQRTA